MEEILYDDFSITKLFITKTINIITKSGKKIEVHCPEIWRFYNDESWLVFFSIISKNLPELQKIFIGTNEPTKEYTSTLDFIYLILFDLSKYQQYSQLGRNIETALKYILPSAEIDYKKHIINIFPNDIITEEIWDYVVYILKLSCGEKVSQPLIFDSAEIKALYLKQQEYESRINQIKQRRQDDKENLIKNFISICYSFPCFDFDYLFQQTLAQIHWLQKLAAGAVSYSFNEKAFAAGNVKKGKKLDFFIK